MNICRRMDLALMLGQSQAIGIPAQRPLARGGIDGQAEEIDQLGSRPALRAVFVKRGSPHAGEIDLSECRDSDQGRDGQQRQKTSHVGCLWYILCETALLKMSRSIWSESLASFSDSVAATRPAPAGVAAAVVAAELGLSLLIKALSITGGHSELADAARRERAHLRGAADEDIGAVMAYMRARDADALRQAIEAPMRAARAAVTGLELCAKASGKVKAALTADLGAAQALLAGSLRAILICIDANLHGREEQHRDAVAERKAIEERARVYSR